MLASLPMSARRERVVVFALIALHVAIYQTICTIKYQYYLYRDFDLAIFVQAIHGVVHGQWFSSIRGMNWLGDHSSLILVPLAPIFALAPHALTLLAMQSVALALGALPVWALARRELPAGPLPLMCAALWLLQPALGYLNLFEFHPETLAVPLLLWAAFELRGGRAGRAALAAGFALLAREDVVLPVLGLAAVALLARPRQPRAAAGLGALAVLSLVLTFVVLKPLLLEGQAEYGRMYAHWGPTPARAVQAMLSRPLDAIAALASNPGDPTDGLRKQQLWLHLFLPVAGLSALAPLWLLPALPVLAEHLLSGRSHQHTIVFQYTALSLPFVVASAVFGLKRAIAWLGEAHATRAGALLLALAAITQVLFGSLVGRQVWQVRGIAEPNLPDAFERTMKSYRDRMLARVPRQGPVVAGFEFLPHLAARDSLHSLHHLLAGTYTYSTKPYPLPARAVALLGDMSAQIPQMKWGSGARLRAVIAGGRLHPADAAGGTILMLPATRDTLSFFEVGAKWAHETLGLVADDQLYFFGAERVDSIVPQGGVLEIASYWKRVAPGNRNYLAQAWLVQGREPVAYGRARALCYGILPPADWPQDSIVRENYHLLIPRDLAPGTYRPAFRLIAVDEDGRQEIPIVQLGRLREEMNAVGLGNVVVTASRSPAPPRAPEAR